MKQTQIIMGMPVTVEVIDSYVTKNDLSDIFSYFKAVDKKFSTYKSFSEISHINNGQLKKSEVSFDMKTIFCLAERTREETDGYFNIVRNDRYDPSGLVKGWAICNAAKRLKKKGFTNFYVDAGGDIEASGNNKDGKPWKVGIKNPFNQNEIIKALRLSNKGIATSGTYIRGQHIYSPKENSTITDIVSMTVIGPNIYDADRFATAAFAMGRRGIYFIEKLSGFEGYMIDRKGIGTYTSGFEKLVC